MNKKILLPLLLSAVALISSRCTLNSSPPLKTVTVSASGITGAFARSPDISTLTCFGVVVGGAPNPVTGSQVGNRAPSCLKLNGAFFGPYSYGEVLSGVKISLPASTLDFSLVGFSKVDGCGSTVASLYPLTGTAETYPITAVQTVNLQSVSKISLTASYTTTDSNLTMLCPPENFTCDNTQSCDRFEGTTGTDLLLHVMDTGTGWSLFYTVDASLINGAVNTFPSSDFVRSNLVVTGGSRHVRVRGKVTTPAGNSTIEAGLMLRFSSPSDYVLGSLYYDYALGTCRLRIVERITGLDNIVNSVVIPNSECAPAQLHSLVLDASDNNYSLTYGTHQITYPSATGSLSGTQAGLAAGYTGTVNGAFIADDFSVELLQ